MASCSIRRAVADETVILAHYLPMVRRIAAHLAKHRPPMLELDDVIQDGMFGLLRAIRCDTQHGQAAQFAVYARTHIRGAIIDGFRHAGNLSHRRYRAAREVLLRAADGEEISPAELDKAVATLALAWACPDSLNDEEQALELADGTPGPERQAIANQLLSRVVEALHIMSPRDRDVFVSYELLDQPGDLTSQRFQISEGRVSQIVREVRRRLVAAVG